jgi:two-component system CitB family sensor kinase
VVASSDPGLLGGKLDIGASRVMEGRAWTGVVAESSAAVLSAHVPVLDDGGKMIGIAAISRNYPPPWSAWGMQFPICSPIWAWPVSWVWPVPCCCPGASNARPWAWNRDEITGLVENREAMLHGLKEGVVALDPNERITVANDSARELLGLPADCVGKKWHRFAWTPH